jgi:hypothetical protein
MPNIETVQKQLGLDGIVLPDTPEYMGSMSQIF